MRAENEVKALSRREDEARALVARVVQQVADAPRFAVPDVEALGRVPADRAGLDAFLRRLSDVARALQAVEAAYGNALREREELIGLFGGYATRAVAHGPDVGPRDRPRRRPRPGGARGRPDAARRRQGPGGPLRRPRPHAAVRRPVPIQLHDRASRSGLMTANPAGLAQGTQPCSVPGCTGVIEDGYCNVCGTPEGAAPIVPAQADSPDSTAAGVHPVADHLLQPARQHAARLGAARAARAPHARSGRRPSGCAGPASARA